MLLVPGLVAVASVATAIACADDEARACRVGADCASGMCGSDGTCVPAGVGSSGSSGSPDGSVIGDATPPPPPDDGGSLVVPGCAPNKDGTILRDEVPIKAGLRANFRVAEEVEVSTAGTPLANDRRKWDLSAALPNDATILVETTALTDKWYAPKFQNATYTTPLRKSSNLIGVFETGPGALALRGVVSPSDDAFTKTELTNDPPVDVLQFPMTVGKKWTTNTSVTGIAQGVVLLGPYTEKYESEVDAAGELVTPLGSFEVMRVRITLTRTVGFVTTTYRSFAFVAECYGNVASIASKENETNAEFTFAAEVRRIAP